MDRRPLVFAVVGAMVTLAVVTLLLALPAADRCTPTGRELWDCVRDDFAERYLKRDADAVVAPVSGTFSPPPPEPDLLADVPAGPPVVFELADVAEDAAIIARDLPAPQSSRLAAVPKRAESELSPVAPAATPHVAEPAVPQAMAPPAPTPPPEIDTIAFDGSGLVAGTGPDGTVIRLYLDGQLAGETRVERGRWQVDDVDLGATLTQELRVDAVDPATGAVLGSSSFTIEIDLPDDPPPGAEAPRVPDPAPIAAPVVEAVQPQAARPVSVPSGIVADRTSDATAFDPVTPLADARSATAEAPLPRARPVPSSRYSPSIMFLGASDGGSIITLGK